MMTTMRSYLTFLVLGLFAMSCGSSDSPTSSNATTGTVKLSMNVSNSGPAAPQTPSILNKATQAAVTVTSAKVVIEKVELENDLDEAQDFEFEQPFVQDLLLVTSLQEIQTLQIPFGTYDELKVVVHELEADDGPVYDQNPDLQGLSILVTGFLNGDQASTFSFATDINLDLKMEFNPPVQIDETSQSANIVLGIDFGVWFVDASGNVLDPKQAGNKDAIENNIKRSFEVFEDDDDDGEEDEDHELKGVIESLGSDHLVVLGTTFWVDANTIVEDDNDQTIAFSALQTGQLVEVESRLRADGSLLATEIELEDD